MAQYRDAAGPEWRGVLSGFIRPGIIGGIPGEIFDPFGRLALAILVIVQGVNDAKDTLIWINARIIKVRIN